jgi:hypothetical protein
VKTISFCITCKNRFHQISQTLPSNLRDNRKDKDRIEFILVDFGSTDSLQDWICANFSEDLDEGYLKYYYTTEMPDWSAPVAKNTAHLLSTGEFLINLDCDNLTGKNGGVYIYNQFQRFGPKLVTHQFSGEWTDGSYGRIGMHRQYFFAIGGYDESFAPMGQQDTDLINRLFEFGLAYKKINNPRYNRAIRNSKEESIKYCNSQFSYYQMNLHNSRLSRLNLYAGKIITNEGSFGIRKDVYEYHQKYFRLVATDIK